MKKDRKEHIHPPTDDSPVTLTLSGNIIEERYMTRNNFDCPIERIDADHYLIKRTGEVKECEHIDTRAEDVASVKQTLHWVRNLINANSTHPNRLRWVTLTYGENMRDEKRLYEDFRRFWEKMKYWAKKQGLHAEYISVAEPQGRGAWHLHLLIIFDRNAPFLPSDLVYKMWGHGFTSTKSVDSNTNLGAYFSAYLSDMELDEALTAEHAQSEIVKKDVPDSNGKMITKAYVKGARLYLYPKGFHICRHSRGIALPRTIKTTEGKARELIGDAPLVYEATYHIYDNAGSVVNTTNYRQFNNKYRKQVAQFTNEPNAITPGDKILPDQSPSPPQD